jgi:hypothetical protein
MTTPESDSDAAKEVRATVEDAPRETILGMIGKFFASTGQAAAAVGKPEQGAVAMGISEGVKDLEHKIEAAKPHLKEMGQQAKAIYGRLDTEHNREFATRISAGRWSRQNDDADNPSAKQGQK